MTPHQLMGEGRELFDRVIAILDSKGLGTQDLSRLSDVLFGRSSHYFIPSNFYYRLRAHLISPNIYQLFALSKISNYRLLDWLRVFGFELDEIPRLQVLLHGRRTVMLNSTTYDKEARVSWFKSLGTRSESHGITPLTQIVAPGETYSVSSIERLNSKAFLYAKVGREDALAYPHLAPGSIVRVIPFATKSCAGLGEKIAKDQFYLVQHSKGLSCCRLRRTQGNRVALVPGALPFASVAMELGRELRVLGLADMEIRPLKTGTHPRVPRELSRNWAPAQLPEQVYEEPLRGLLRASRLQSGLTPKEASLITQRIAEELRDQRYVIKKKSLANYEVLNTPPQHIHKIISLCVLFGICFWDFLAAAGMNMRDAGKDAIPGDLLANLGPNVNRQQAHEFGDRNEAPPLPFPLSSLEEMPLFLRAALSSVSGLPRLSIRDVFWTGAIQEHLHPLTRGSCFIAVNRRVKRPMHLPFVSIWEKPLCLVLMRDGTYVCGQCTLRGDSIVLDSPVGSSNPPRALRKGIDAEIAGQVVAIVRRL